MTPAASSSDFTLAGATPTEPIGKCELIALTAPDLDQLKLGAVRALFAADLIAYDLGLMPAAQALGRRDAARDTLGPARDIPEFVASRLAALLAPLSRGESVAYITNQDAGAVTELAQALRTRGVLTQVW